MSRLLAYHNTLTHYTHRPTRKSQWWLWQPTVISKNKESVFVWAIFSQQQNDKSFAVTVWTYDSLSSHYKIFVKKLFIVRNKRQLRSQQRSKSSLFFQHMENYRKAGSFGMCTLERKIKAIKIQILFENGYSANKISHISATRKNV